MTIKIAIVGAGPSGFYTADALRKTVPCEIDLIERLPTPFGLIRFGVAPDHQSTKRVVRAYERTLAQPDVRFFGNVALGRDVELDELRAFYDAVILAVGAGLDRPLDIPGANKRGVYGSGAFVGWYNGHPDYVDLAPDLDTETVAIIGNGNVAIDIARILVKTPDEMACTDLPEYAAEAITRARLRDVHILGRRGPIEAKFTNVELREMGALASAEPIVDPADLPAAVGGEMSDRDRRMKEKNLATLREFAAREPASHRRRVYFRFYLRPVEVLGGERVEGLRMERTRLDESGRVTGTGEIIDLPCGIVVAAIGYRAMPVGNAPFDNERGVVVHKNGKVADGIYAVGWVKRGPVGVIGTNKSDGEIVARTISEECAPSPKPGRQGLVAHLTGRGVRWVTYTDWRALDEAEVEAAPPGAPRRKFVHVDEMLDVVEEGRDDGASRTG